MPAAELADAPYTVEKPPAPSPSSSKSTIGDSGGSGRPGCPNPAVQLEEACKGDGSILLCRRPEPTGDRDVKLRRLSRCEVKGAGAGEGGGEGEEDERETERARR
jgi:hypothetical protein